MAFSDGDLIDFLRGELSPSAEAEMRAALESDASLAARLRDIQATLKLTSESLPEISPATPFRLQLESSLDGESHASAAQEQQIDAQLANLKAATPVWNDAAVAERLRAKLAGVMAADSADKQAKSNPSSKGTASDRESVPSLDLVILCDYWHDELRDADRVDVEALLHADSKFAALSRSVQRTLRVLKPFTLHPTRADRERGWETLQRLLADQVAAPSAQAAELIDHCYGALDESEEASLATRLSAAPSLRAELTALERDLVTLRRVPQIGPSDALKARIAGAIEAELAKARSGLEDQRAGSRWEVLRGVKAKEHAEAMIESDGAGLNALATTLSQISEVPNIEPSDDLRARIAAALHLEVAAQRPATESLRLRLIRAMPIGRSQPESLMPAEPRRLNLVYRTSLRGWRAVSAWRPLAAASILHALLLTASMALIFGVSARRADSIAAYQVRQGAPSQHAEVSDAIGPNSYDAKEIVDPERALDGDPFQLTDLGEAPDGDSGLGSTIRAAAAAAYARHGMALTEEARQEIISAERARGLGAGSSSDGGYRFEEMYSMRGLSFELKSAAFANPEQGAKLLLILESTLKRIVSSQRADGSWGDLEGQDVPQLSTDLPWRIESRRIENTALALLALLGDGYRMGDGTLHGAAITKGINYLLDHQNNTGGFVSIVEKGELVPQGVLHSDAIATLALVETYGATPAKHLGMPLRRALTRVALAQNEAGWWPYLRGGELDMVTSAWAVQALEGAAKIGWRPNYAAAAAERFRVWLRTIDGPLYSRPAADSQQSASRALASGVSALAAMRGAFDPSKSGQKTVMRFLVGDYYAPSLAVTRGIGVSQRQNANFTAWYFGSLAAYLDTPPQDAEGYLDVLYGALLNEDGSASFSGLEVGTCELEATRGNLFVDAMAALTIENAYRLRAAALKD